MRHGTAPRRAGIARATLYRNHPDIIADFLTQAADAASYQQAPPQQTRPNQQLVERVAKLRQENENLRLHVELYEEHIRRLTVENHRMRTHLAQLNNVTALDHRQRGKR